MTYAKAGVDARHIHDAHKLLARRLESTFATRKGKVGWPIFPIGHYAGLVDLGQGRVLSLHTDSVGTKVLVAQMMRKYDTIGIDCVAMCANDLICTGAEPTSFLGDRVREGDVLVGVTSSGIHSNGLSLARKVLLKRYKLNETPPGLGRGLGRELLEPTRIYVKAVQEIIEKVEVHGLAH